MAQMEFQVSNLAIVELLIVIIKEVRGLKELMSSGNSPLATLATLVPALTSTIAAETVAINTQAEALATEHTAIQELLADFAGTSPSPAQQALLDQLQTAVTNATNANTLIGNSTSAIQSDSAAVTAALPPSAPTLASTSTTLSASETTAAVGDTVSLSSTVSGATPTGSIEFLDGETSLGSVAVDVTGTASFAVTSITAGSHSFTAVYSGDAENATSTSSAVVVSAS
jgi:hypothetical protein